MFVYDTINKCSATKSVFLHFQVHTKEHYAPWKQNISNYMSTFLEALKDLQNMYGFQLISYEPNLLLERRASQDNKYYPFFDIVLYKPY